MLRLGLGILKSPIEKRTDWIYITDFSIQLGKERCLLILGVTQQSLLENGYELCHKQVRVLDIYVQEHFNGQDVFNRLSVAKERTGIPVQIISDKGNDICKGIEMFCANNKGVIPTSDVTHMVGVVLKHYLERNSRWICLQEDLLSLTQQVKQSELSFLRPIASSKKARWLNIKQEIEWLENIYNYEKKGDYSLISTEYKIENTNEIYEKLITHIINKNDQKRIEKELKNKKFKNAESFADWIQNNELIDESMVKLVDVGEARYNEKFCILNKHKEFFKELKQLNDIAESIKVLIRKEGLSLDSLQKVEVLYNKITYPDIIHVFNKINNNLQMEHSKCGIEEKPLLCCSEIIESIFGKFKVKAKQSIGGIYQSVLSIALICNNTTPEMITEILSNVKMSDVEEWFKSMAGISNLTKRKLAFR